jgi:hypothetical protein
MLLDFRVPFGQFTYALFNIAQVLLKFYQYATEESVETLLFCIILTVYLLPFPPQLNAIVNDFECVDLRNEVIINYI